MHRNLPRRRAGGDRRARRGRRGEGRRSSGRRWPRARSVRRAGPRIWLVEELDQGLDLGQLGHRPMMPPLSSGRGPDGSGGDGTVGAVEVGARGEAPRRAPGEHPRAPTGRPRGHGVDRWCVRRLRAVTGPAPSAADAARHRAPDVEHGPDEHDHDDRPHRHRGPGGLVRLRGRSRVRIGDASPSTTADPQGRTIKIALEMRPAADPAQRIGSLVINPGGPGTSGIDDLPERAERAHPRTARPLRHRLLRSPGGGAQRTRCRAAPATRRRPASSSTTTTVAAPTPVELPDPVPVGAGGPEGARWPRTRPTPRPARSTAAACSPTWGRWTRPRTSTGSGPPSGDAKLTFIGHSYGTLLGATYAEMYPGNVRAMVLDGAIDPALSTEQMVLDQAEGFESVLDDFFSWCAGTPPVRGDRRATPPPPCWRSSTERRRSDCPVADGGSAGPGEFYNALLDDLYSRSSWPVAGRRPGGRRRPANGTDLITSSTSYASGGLDQRGRRQQRHQLPRPPGVP